MKLNRKLIEEFWNWFAKNADIIGQINDPDAPILAEAHERLKRIDDRLWIEVSEPNEDGMQALVITTEGDLDAFPAADAVVDKAPPIKGWEVFSLKPEMGFDFTTTFEDLTVEPATMWFQPLENEEAAHELGLKIAIPEFSEQLEETFFHAAAIVIDTGLGERAAAKEIHYIEVCEVPRDPEGEGFVPLVELPEFMEWRRNRQKKRK